MNEMRAIIFDFNGVIVDDEPLHLELFHRVLEEEGLKISDREYHEKYLGYDDRGCLTAVLNDRGRSYEVDYIDRLIARKAEYYQEEIQNRCALFPGVIELVRRSARRFPLAIASGALRDEIELVLERGGIRGCFEVIVSAEDVSACKPDPEGYLKALSELCALKTPNPAIKPGECLVIEDSIAGVQAAKRAGMRCLAVTNSYRAEELREADRVVSSLIDCEPETVFITL